MKQITVLKGDGIGPEIIDACLKVLAHLSHDIKIEEKYFGGIAIDKCDGQPLPSETLTSCFNADAILLGAVGGPKWDAATIRPEAGLLELRKQLGLFANLRPINVIPGLEDLSPVKNVAGVNLVIIRELTGGMYFGEHSLNDEYARDENRYQRFEIERIANFAFEYAVKHDYQKVTQVDKSNVLATSKLWRQVVTDLAPSTINLTHELVDACAIKLITKPQDFQVILTENLFGDILSDEASALTGSLGLSPSASYGTNTPLYEPIAGSAPDIAGKNLANPTGALLSLQMLLDDLGYENKIGEAVQTTIKNGYRTADIGGNLSTTEFTDKIIESL